MIHIYLPVFVDLQLTSCYAYLEKRFDKNVKMMASMVSAIQAILFIPIVMYVPALALSQGKFYFFYRRKKLRMMDIFWIISGQ